MIGTVLTYRPGATEPVVETLDKPADLEFIKARLDGGWLETVPGFDHIEHEGRICRCVVFCDEEGKLKELPYNRKATMAWNDALPTGLQGTDGRMLDVLVGPIVVFMGDTEFMESL